MSSLIIDESFSIFNTWHISCLGHAMLFCAKSKSSSLVVTLLDISIIDGNPKYTGLFIKTHSILGIIVCYCMNSSTTWFPIIMIVGDSSFLLCKNLFNPIPLKFKLIYFFIRK